MRAGLAILALALPASFWAGGVTLEAFRAYYRRSPAGALQVRWAWQPAPRDPLTDALFKHLDRDRDGKLSREELLAAPAVLNRLDLDGDEMVTPTELGSP